jgi:hypothetical protein
MVINGTVTVAAATVGPGPRRICCKSSNGRPGPGTAIIISDYMYLQISRRANFGVSDAKAVTVTDGLLSARI